MAYILVEDFKAGLDTRKTILTAPPGSLQTLENAHITRGGEIEKRKAFKSYAALPANTFGIAAANNQLYVFGSAAAPTMPTGVLYQRLQHPTGLAMTGVLDWETFNGKLYVVAQYSDGSVYHFYDGARVTDWYDGRARASFSVTGGSASAGATASGSFVLGGGGIGDQITAVRVASTNLLSASVDYDTDLATTVAALVAEINTGTGTHGYVAANVGYQITLTSSSVGASYNGLAVTADVTGTFTVSAVQDMAGGADANAITSIKVNGVEILGASVAWGADNATTAQAVVDQVTLFGSSPEYEAVRNGTAVNITASTSGTTANGYSVQITTSGNVTANPTSTTMAGGADSSGTYTPGTSCRTVKSKMYSTSGSLLHFSAINDPVHWTTSYTGAGIINMANQDAGSESLVGLEIYYNRVAVFSRSSVQLWQLDADPAQNMQTQVVRNNGAVASGAIAQFGDADVFYLSDSGLRSLRARDASNAAAVSDVGTPIDKLLVDHMAALGTAETAKAKCIVEPVTGRFWLALGDTVYVFSYFAGSKIAAWSTYKPGFTVDGFASLGSRVYIRAGSTVYLYGGATGSEYDSATVTVELPMLDGQQPATSKTVSGVDIACSNSWGVYLGTDPLTPTTRDMIGQVTSTTYSLGKVAALGEGTHLGLKLVCAAPGAATLSNVIVHFTPVGSG